MAKKEKYIANSQTLRIGQLCLYRFLGKYFCARISAIHDIDADCVLHEFSFCGGSHSVVIGSIVMFDATGSGRMSPNPSYCYNDIANMVTEIFSFCDGARACAVLEYNNDKQVAYENVMDFIDGKTLLPLFPSEQIFKRMASALKTMIYEATCLSAEENDGSHVCKITKEALYSARESLKEATAHSCQI